MLKKTFLCVLIFAAAANYLYGVRATPEPVVITQPDGTEITVYLRGDEFFHFHTTVDGYLLKADEQGILRYAVQNADGQFIPSAIRANDISKRKTDENAFIKTLNKNFNFDAENTLARQSRQNAPAHVAAENTPIQRFPANGSPKSLVILVNFSDKSFVVSNPQQAFTDLLNQQGYSANGGTGSARDYFIDASSGVFNPQFNVVGPYSLPKTMSYYAGSDGTENAPEMVAKACALADSAGIDFSQYDTDGDGYVDGIFVYYAGNNWAEGARNTVWPHKYALYPNSLPQGTQRTFDDVTVLDYACSSELRGTSPLSSAMCGIGTFTHEFGHILGLPDLYHTTANKNTLNSWDVMDSGSYNNSGKTPPSYSAYERYFMGWLTPELIATPQNDTLVAINTSNRAFIVTNNTEPNYNGQKPTPREFFMLENRQKTGWDAYLPGHGLLVWHIDFNQYIWSDHSVNNYSGSQQTQASHMRVYIEPTDGLSQTTPGSAFTSGSFTPELWNGTDINRPLTYIKEENGIISFRFMGGGNMPVVYAESNFTPFETVTGTPSEIQTFKVSGKTLSAPVTVSFVNNTHFEIKTAESSAWAKTLMLTPQNSVLDTTVIQVRYNPTESSFNATHAETIKLTSTSADEVTVNISGTSTRPVLVVPPVAYDANSVTSSSFVANWESVPDASGYYLTVYTVSEGENMIIEGFNQGLQLPDGWTTNATNTTNSIDFSGQTPPALSLRNTGDYLQTKTFLTSADGLSFVAKSLSGYGSLYVKAWKGNEFVDIDTITINSDFSETQTYNFNENENYTAFRIEFTKTNGTGVALDDVTITFDKTFDVVINEKWVEGVSDTVKNLAEKTEYFYRVKASDKTLKPNGEVLYENITDYSNVIKAVTKDANGLLTVIKDNDDIFALVASGETLCIYSILGQMVSIVESDGKPVNISNLLPKRQVYILKSGNRTAKVVL